MNPSSNVSSGAPATVSDRASLRTTRQRKRRVWRHVVTSIVVVIAMVVLVMARRDQQDVNRCLETMQHVVHTLEREGARRSGVPVFMPQPPVDGAMSRSHYHYSPGNAQYMVAGGPAVGLVCCDQSHRLFTRTDGRYVVVGEGGGFQVLWMSESEFQRRAAELHLPATTVSIEPP